MSLFPQLPGHTYECVFLSPTDVMMFLNKYEADYLAGQEITSEVAETRGTFTFHNTNFDFAIFTANGVFSKGGGASSSHFLLLYIILIL